MDIQEYRVICFITPHNNATVAKGCDARKRLVLTVRFFILYTSSSSMWSSTSTMRRAWSTLNPNCKCTRTYVVMQLWRTSK